MSAHSTQNYYLINLSTRTVSVSTHLRSDNYTLKSGKCIYLGGLTDELILKYNKYSALNISLRIVTKDKLLTILNKSINLNNEQMQLLLNNSTPRVEHQPGSISEAVFCNVNVNANSTCYNSTTPNSSSNLFNKSVPSNNYSVIQSSNLKHEDSTKILEQPSQQTQSSSESKVVTQKNNSITESCNLQTSLQKESEQIEKQIQVQYQSDNNSENLSSNEEQTLYEEKINETTDYNLNTNVNENTNNDYNVLEESIKQDVKNMSYNELYDLVKQKNLLTGGRGKPSKAKLIEILTNDLC